MTLIFPYHWDHRNLSCIYPSYVLMTDCHFPCESLHSQAMFTCSCISGLSSQKTSKSMHCRMVSRSQLLVGRSLWHFCGGFILCWGYPPGGPREIYLYCNFNISTGYALYYIIIRLLVSFGKFTSTRMVLSWWTCSPGWPGVLFRKCGKHLFTPTWSPDHLFCSVD